MKFAGFSLSFCVSAILSNRVKLEQVEYIIPGFNYKGEIDESYFTIYWRKWPKEQVIDLLKQINICQMYMIPGINIARGIWYPAGEEQIPLFNQDDYAHWRLRDEELNMPLVRCKVAVDDVTTVGKIYAIWNKVDNQYGIGEAQELVTHYGIVDDVGQIATVRSDCFEEL